jgi:hypothetical protein
MCDQVFIVFARRLWVLSDPAKGRPFVIGEALQVEYLFT